MFSICTGDKRRLCFFMTKQIPSDHFIVFSDTEVKVLIQKSFENDTENTYSAKVIF